MMDCVCFLFECQSLEGLNPPPTAPYDVLQINNHTAHFFQNSHNTVFLLVFFVAAYRTQQQAEKKRGFLTQTLSTSQVNCDLHHTAVFWVFFVLPVSLRAACKTIWKSSIRPFFQLWFGNLFGIKLNSNRSCPVGTVVAN